MKCIQDLKDGWRTATRTVALATAEAGIITSTAVGTSQQSVSAGLVWGLAATAVTAVLVPWFLGNVEIIPKTTKNPPCGPN